MTEETEYNTKNAGTMESNTDLNNEDTHEDSQMPAENKRPVKTYRLKRMAELATPKESRAIWVTSPSEKVQWGTQETLWPVSKKALSADASFRLLRLSTPKRNFQAYDQLNRPQFMFSCGRPSKIWASCPAMETSERITTLAQPKRVPEYYEDNRDNFLFSCGRSSPIWSVHDAAKSARQRSATNRLGQLAKSKNAPPDFIPNKGVQTIITQSALCAQLTPHLAKLSEPRPRPEGPYRDPQWNVSQEAKLCACTSRCGELARPKELPDEYRPLRWKLTVPVAALKAQATKHIQDLACPVTRATMDHLQFDPNAFRVREAALKGRCSARTEELAAPIVR
eukprot:GHVU01146862.1.p1 GENE.GHVU01146862.1~~GHVU01146862.1.p1  ORF type:complete len:338 (+),score=18.65 GHVU01146862.1:334-1347(+)